MIVEKSLIEYREEIKSILYKDREFLYIAYIVCEMSKRELGKLCNCSYSTIIRRLKKYKIPLRSYEESLKLRDFLLESALYRDKEFLYITYIVCEMSSNEIAKICKCSGDVIITWLKKYKFPIRSRIEALKISQNRYEFKKNTSLFQKGRTHSEETKKKLSEINKGKKLSEETKKKISISQLGKKLSEETKKKMSESRKGEKSYNWIKDRTKRYFPYTEKYMTDNEFRKRIFDFQKGRDLLTGDLLNKKYQLHHINKDTLDDSHYIEGDYYCNLGFLLSYNHRLCDNSKRFEKNKHKLLRNALDLKEGKIPYYWKEKNKNLIFNNKRIQLINRNRFY